jgi:ribosomal protein L37AE/L43A
VTRSKRIKKIPPEIIWGVDSFRCPILEHCTDADRCSVRRVNKKLWPKCGKCPVLLPGEVQEPIKPKRKYIRKKIK